VRAEAVHVFDIVAGPPYCVMSKEAACASEEAKSRQVILIMQNSVNNYRVIVIRYINAPFHDQWRDKFN
jgi:hypothetical protein